jgi:hypothetical protein
LNGVEISGDAGSGICPALGCDSRAKVAVPRRDLFFIVVSESGSHAEDAGGLPAQKIYRLVTRNNQLSITLHATPRRALNRPIGAIGNRGTADLCSASINFSLSTY